MPQLEHASCLLHSNGNWCITLLTDLHLFLHLKRFIAGKSFNSDDELKQSVEKWLTSVWWHTCINWAHKTLWPVMTSASMWMVLMSKYTLRYVESGSNE
jgi:hypothetical protein